MVYSLMVMTHRIQKIDRVFDLSLGDLKLVSYEILNEVNLGSMHIKSLLYVVI